MHLKFAQRLHAFKGIFMGKNIFFLAKETQFYSDLFLQDDRMYNVDCEQVEHASDMTGDT